MAVTARRGPSCERSSGRVGHARHQPVRRWVRTGLPIALVTSGIAASSHRLSKQRSAHVCSRAHAAVLRGPEVTQGGPDPDRLQRGQLLLARGER